MLFRDEPWPEGTPSWVDLVVPDQAKAVAFSRGLLGRCPMWTRQRRRSAKPAVGSSYR
jgi:hypothetical protein